MGYGIGGLLILILVILAIIFLRRGSSNLILRPRAPCRTTEHRARPIPNSGITETFEFLFVASTNGRAERRLAGQLNRRGRPNHVHEHGPSDPRPHRSPGRWVRVARPSGRDRLRTLPQITCVELRGIEPLTSSMPWKRSAN